MRESIIGISITASYVIKDRHYRRSVRTHSLKIRGKPTRENAKRLSIEIADYLNNQLSIGYETPEDTKPPRKNL